MEGKEMNLWTADLAPGAQTGKHHHPTPRFVIVLEGSVVSEMEGKPPQTFKAGQAFQEPPDVVHNFRMRARPSRPKLLESSMREKGSLSRSMTTSGFVVSGS
jgi:quercetin dioxygenase-like cupin family protein